MTGQAPCLTPPTHLDTYHERAGTLPALLPPTCPASGASPEPFFPHTSPPPTHLDCRAALTTCCNRRDAMPRLRYGSKTPWPVDRYGVWGMEGPLGFEDRENTRPSLLLRKEWKGCGRVGRITRDLALRCISSSMTYEGGLALSVTPSAMADEVWGGRDVRSGFTGIDRVNSKRVGHRKDAEICPEEWVSLERCK